MEKYYIFFREKHNVNLDFTDKYFKHINNLFNQNRILSESEKMDIVNEICTLSEYYCSYINHLISNTCSENAKALRDKKVMNGKKPKMFNDNDVREMIKLKNQGFSNVQIAKKFKCSEKTVRNYLKK